MRIETSLFLPALNEATQQTELRAFLLAYDEDLTEYSTLWGHMFDFYALSMLSAGGTV